jgi:hypothetical protein
MNPAMTTCRTQSPISRPRGLEIILLILALLVWSPAVAQDQDDDLSLLIQSLAATHDDKADEHPFRVDEFRSPHKVWFVAVNNSPAVITLSFGMTGSNFNSDKKLPVTLVIAPNSSQDIVHATQATRWEPLRFSYRYAFQPGHAFTSPDRHARYLLPFEKGTPFLVVQSPDSVPGTGTLITHNNDHSRYAFDFGVPEGTLVTAARNGVVIDVKDAFTVGRPDPSLSNKANFVAIMHADHSIAYYIHLAPQSALVKRGQWVRAGAAIAYSGNTGYTFGPHLHFDVRRAAISEKGEVVHLSVPVDFYKRDEPDEKIMIEEGMLIRAR